MLVPMQNIDAPDALGDPDEFEIPDSLDPQPPSPFRRPRRPGSSQFAPPSGRRKSTAGRPYKYRRSPTPIDTQVGRVIVDIAPIMVAKGIISSGFGHKGNPNLSALSRGAGLSTHTAYALLRRPDTISAISLDVIARVCEYLDCRPGDWITYLPTVAPSPRKRG